ncbi:MAG: lipid-A-disaccharide synthase [Campylobacterales bacterium]|nr:lipid-A-disaccharide synthase [Campylobacterales bacterium]
MKLLVSALEPSSNVHLKAMLQHTHDIELSGIFEDSLGKPLCDISQMAIMGISDVFKKIAFFKGLLKKMTLLAKDADKVLLMDSSGFNLPLAQKIKEYYPDKEIIYYILPQIWASRPKRVKKLELYCDKLLGILPFEIDYYKSGKAKYVGHPLLDEIKISNTAKNDGTIAFLPGSRKSEIQRLFPIFKALKEKLPNKRSFLVVPATFSEQKVEEYYGDTNDFEIIRDTHIALAQSEFAFICSGTATLEAALIGTPFILTYIAKKMDFFIGTKIFGIKQIGLANIILNRVDGSILHEEIVQSDVNVKNLLMHYKNMDRDTFLQKTATLKKYLNHGSSENVAKIIMER